MLLLIVNRSFHLIEEAAGKLLRGSGEFVVTASSAPNNAANRGYEELLTSLIDRTTLETYDGRANLSSTVI